MCSWIFAAHMKEFIYGNKPQYSLFCSLALIFKNTYFTWQRNILYSSRCLKTWQKNVFFRFGRSAGTIKILINIKKLKQYKICLEINLWRKKKFCKTTRVCKVFRITMFSWQFCWLFRIINVHQYFFTFDILFDEMDRGLRHEKSILLDTIYR